MGDADIAGASRPTRRLTLVSLAVWIILTLALPLSALTLNFIRLGGFPLGFWIAAQGAILGLVLLVLFYAWRAGGTATREGLWPALVFAAEAVGAVTILGFTGYIAALGYDGLALPLGLVAGLALLAMLVAPRFVLYPVHTISGFFAVRYGGKTSRRLALAITTTATILLLAADLKAGAHALQSLTRIKLSEAVAVLALAVGVLAIAGSLLGRRRITGLSFAVILIGLLATLTAIALNAGSSGVPHLALGNALETYAKLNQTLIVNKLSDFKSLTPMASPFLQLSMRNFAGLMLAVALGIVAAPHLLGRHVSQAAVAPGGAVRRAALALVAVALVAASLPPLAVYSRLAFEQAMSKGIETAAIPQTFAEASALGWVKVCDRSSDLGSDLTAACAKASGQRGFLRLQDVAFTTDGFVVAAPQLSGLDPRVLYPLVICVLLAALLAGNALVAGLVAADREERTIGATQSRNLDLRSLVVGGGVLLSALLIAAKSAIDTGLLATEGFALLAAGIFPALVLGLYWRRINGFGAVAAMLTGFLIVAVYLLGLHLWPVEFFRALGGFSDAAPAALRRFNDLDAAVAAASDPQAQAAARETLVRYAASIANWGGLKPAAIVLVAVPAGFAAGLVGSLLSKAKPELAPGG